MAAKAEAWMATHKASRSAPRAPRSDPPVTAAEAFSAKSVVCYVILGFEELARDHAAAIEQAEARLDEFAPVSQPPKRHHSVGKILQHL